MTDRYILDTDTIVDVLRGRSEVAMRLAALSPDDVRVSAISVAELHYGAIDSSDPARNHAEVERLLEQIAILPFGRASALAHARVRAATRRQPIGGADMIIAATALAVDAVVVTSNLRAFERVPKLRMESWRGV